MFRLIPREEKFFDLFEKQIDAVGKISPLLLQISQAKAVDPLWAGLSADIEREGDKAAEELFRKLRGTFVTPFDREDIYRLIDAIDDFLDFIDEAIGKISDYGLVGDAAINDFITVVRKMIIYAKAGVYFLRVLKTFDQKKFTDVNLKVTECEHIADQLDRVIKRESYEVDVAKILGKTPGEPFLVEEYQRVLDAINYKRKRREIAEILEEGADAGRDIFHILGEIIEKNI